MEDYLYKVLLITVFYCTYTDVAEPWSALRFDILSWAQSITHTQVVNHSPSRKTKAFEETSLLFHIVEYEVWFACR